MTSIIKVNNIQSSSSNAAISIESSGSVSTFKRPQVHLMNNQSPNTYTVANNDFSNGGNLALLTNSTAVDFTWDVNGAMTPTHAGLYYIYAKTYLYTNSTSGVGWLSAYKGGTGSAPYGTQGTDFANLGTFEWSGTMSSGRIDYEMIGFHVEYITAGQRVHITCTSTDYFLGAKYHACGMIKLD